jgi:hypothetical protein
MREERHPFVFQRVDHEIDILLTARMITILDLHRHVMQAPPEIANEILGWHRQPVK